MNLRFGRIGYNTSLFDHRARNRANSTGRSARNLSDAAGGERFKHAVNGQ